jgi:ABC-type uncharacterized transport system ATPase subunit
MGKNGAGKSTIMNFLGLLSRSRGYIQFTGQNVKIQGPQDALENGLR